MNKTCDFCSQPQQAPNEKVIILNKILANEMVLYFKLYNYHWNVVGPTFSELHAMFQTQYETLIAHIDVLAERIRALFGIPVSTMKDCLQNTCLREGDPNSHWSSMIEDLMNDHAVISDMISKAFKSLSELKDDGSADLILGLQADHDKFVWMLKSHLDNR